MSIVVLILLFILCIVLCVAFLDYMGFLRFLFFESILAQDTRGEGRIYSRKQLHVSVVCYFLTCSVFSFQGSLADLTRCTEYALIQISKSLGRPYYFPKIMCCYYSVDTENAAFCNFLNLLFIQLLYASLFSFR